MSKPIAHLVITDLDNTLYDWVSFFAAAHRALIDETVRITTLDREALLDDVRRVNQEAGESERQFSLVDAACIQERWPTATRQERIGHLDEAFHAFNRVRKEQLRLYPGVLDTLQSLTKLGIPLVAHTAASGVNAITRLEKLNLANMFSHIIAADSGEQLRVEGRPPITLLGPQEHKPNPAAALRAATELGVAAENVVYVGDSTSSDIVLANAAGMISVFASYGKKSYSTADWDSLVRITHWQTIKDSVVPPSSAPTIEDPNPEPLIVLKDFRGLLAQVDFQPAPAPAP